MKKNKSRGFTLVEIIVSVAILGLLISMFLSAFYSGAVNILYSGQKSSQLMDLQSIVDDLNEHPFFNQSEIITYLSSTKSYHQVTDTNQLSTMVPGETVNFYISEKETKAGTSGYSVILLKFIDNGTRSAKIMTFILERGS